MAILNKEDFMSRLKAKIGDDTSDEAMSFLEDMTDTFNDLDSRSNNNSNSEWEQKYNDLDNSWREKYKARFFSSDEGNPPPIGGTEGGEEPPSADETTFDDLFTESEV